MHSNYCCPSCRNHVCSTVLREFRVICFCRTHALEHLLYPRNHHHLTILDFRWFVSTEPTQTYIAVACCCCCCFVLFLNRTTRCSILLLSHNESSLHTCIRACIKLFSDDDCIMHIQKKIAHSAQDLMYTCGKWKLDNGRWRVEGRSGSWMSALGFRTCVVVEANTVPHGTGCVNVIMYEVQLRPLITLERETI